MSKILSEKTKTMRKQGTPLDERQWFSRTPPPHSASSTVHFSFVASSSKAAHAPRRRGACVPGPVSLSLDRRQALFRSHHTNVRVLLRTFFCCEEPASPLSRLSAPVACVGMMNACLEDDHELPPSSYVLARVLRGIQQPTTDRPPRSTWHPGSTHDWSSVVCVLSNKKMDTARFVLFRVVVGFRISRTAFFSFFSQLF